MIGQVSPIVTILISDWLSRNSGSPIYNSPAMQCGRQTYKSLSDIVDRFASDQQYWSGTRHLPHSDSVGNNTYN